MTLIKWNSVRQQIIHYYTRGDLQTIRSINIEDVAFQRRGYKVSRLRRLEIEAEKFIRAFQGRFSNFT